LMRPTGTFSEKVGDCSMPCAQLAHSQKNLETVSSRWHNVFGLPEFLPAVPSLGEVGSSANSVQNYRGFVRGTADLTFTLSLVDIYGHLVRVRAGGGSGRGLAFLSKQG